MNESLFLLEADETDEAPRCRMCHRPARWIPTHGQFSAYCSGRGCANSTRICRACRGVFECNTGTAGTKYCSDDCKRIGYRPARSTRSAKCAWCESPAPHNHARGGIWPYVCVTCLSPIRHVLGRLKHHRVPIGMVRRLLDDHGCAVCDRDLLSPMPVATTGRLQALLVVDHDHSCCPRATSCGGCVRGFLCGKCNTAAGLLGDSPQNALRLGRYLSADTRRSVAS